LLFSALTPFHHCAVGMGVVLRLYVDIVRVCCTYLAFVTSWVVDLYMIDIVPIFKSSSLTLLMVFRCWKLRGRLPLVVTLTDQVRARQT
jgi:hypothetical protein